MRAQILYFPNQETIFRPSELDRARPSRLASNGKRAGGADMSMAKMSTAEIIPFDFEMQAVRVVLDESGMPWFVAKDVAVVLGYKNHSDAIKRHCKGVVKHYPLETAGGTQDVRVVHEPDVLRLIINSKLPAAQRFEAWVFEEVLPTIRKTGQYEIAGSNQTMEPNGRGWKIREGRRVMEDIARMAQIADKTPPRLLQVVCQGTTNITGIDPIALLEDAGYEAPSYVSDAADRMQRIADWLLSPEQVGQQRFSGAEILKGALNIEKITRSEQVSIGYIMKRLGWNKTRDRSGANGQYYYNRP